MSIAITTKKRSRYQGFNHIDRIIGDLNITEEERREISIVSKVLPFKVNNYVINELIRWDNYHNDPIFNLIFPQRDMLPPELFDKLSNLVDQEAPAASIDRMVAHIRSQLNPHPAGQMTDNKPVLHGQSLEGLQHKYPQTLLFFPTHGQTCHAYCTYCFRWPQFTGQQEWKIAGSGIDTVIEYIRHHPEITDILFTGGDPMVMHLKRLQAYIEPLIAADGPALRTIRIGTKALSFWPYRFLTDPDAAGVLDLFKRIKQSGKKLAIMAHFSHPAELKTRAVKRAIERLLSVGAVIYTQSPIIRHINDRSETWSDMWQKQTALDCIPYYMFLPRDTGAQTYFAVTLERASRIYRDAWRSMSGLSRTVKGPSMSAGPGKVSIMGVQTINGEKVFVLQFLQARNPDWVGIPFFAAYNPKAIWLDDLKPAFGEARFFFES